MLRVTCFLRYSLVIKNLTDNEIYISVKLISLIVKNIICYINKYFNIFFSVQFLLPLIVCLCRLQIQIQSCSTLKKSDQILISSSTGGRERSIGAPPVMKIDIRAFAIRRDRDVIASLRARAHPAK